MEPIADKYDPITAEYESYFARCNISSKKDVFDSEYYKSARDNDNNDRKRIRAGVRPITGYKRCPKCGEMNTLTQSLQTSAGDEQTGTSNECYGCGHFWK